MTIHVEDLKFQCIIGILDFERITPQDIIINLSIDYDYKYGFINYANIVSTCRDLMIKSQFRLIEDAINSINLKLNKEYKAIKSIKIKLSKPSILPDCIVSVSNNYISKS